MKKRLLVLGLVLGLGIGTSSVAYAAQIPVVCLTEQEQFEYYKDSDEETKVNRLALTQFTGMAQGDMRTQTIRLHNSSSHRANFYITKATINALQIQNLTSNGMYQFRLQVGKSMPTAESLLYLSSDQQKDFVQRRSHHSEKLNNFVYVTTLDADCDTYLFLTFKMDRRGGGAVSEDAYMKMLEDIPIAFRAYDHEADSVYTENTQITYSVDSTELLVEENDTQTEDGYRYGVFGVMLLGGVALVGSAVIAKNRKK